MSTHLWVVDLPVSPQRHVVSTHTGTGDQTVCVCVCVSVTLGRGGQVRVSPIWRLCVCPAVNRASGSPEQSLLSFPSLFSSPSQNSAGLFTCVTASSIMGRGNSYELLLPYILAHHSSQFSLSRGFANGIRYLAGYHSSYRVTYLIQYWGARHQ